MHDRGVGIIPYSGLSAGERQHITRGLDSVDEGGRGGGEERREEVERGLGYEDP